MQSRIELTPSILLRAYANGLFPMGHDGGAVHWYSPDPRALLPLPDVHVPSNLDRRVRRREFQVTSNRAFGRVLHACADRDRTWITDRIIDAYTDLHERGYAHSVEAWTRPEEASPPAGRAAGRSDGGANGGAPAQEAELAGGLYGVMIGGGFFGESMFFNVSNASKVTLIHLVRQLRAGGAVLLDTQYSNPHLEQFGVIEIPREQYLAHLADALTVDATWWPLADADAADLQTPVASLNAPGPHPHEISSPSSADAPS